MHTPVLLQEAIDGLDIKPNGLYIDATVGEGGHMQEIVKRGGKVLGIDADQEQIKKLELEMRGYQRKITLVQGNFADVEEIASSAQFAPVDGILFDLGLSFAQIQQSGRGFSYRKPEEALDMRIDTESEVTAEDIVNDLDQDELYDLFARLGEDIHSREISQEIVRTRAKKRIEKVGDLTEVIDEVVGTTDTKSYARIFQALRMAVNHEKESIRKGLEGAVKILKPGGRCVVITFQSIEDRIVKQFITKHSLNQINKKVNVDRALKPFERSAKIRIFEI